MYAKRITQADSGFTLIELLVVIAIIGVLSSVVLASLNSSRNKSKDAATKSQMNEMRSQAELYRAFNDGFGSDGGNDGVGGCTALSNMFGDTGERGLSKLVTGVSNSMPEINGETRVICVVAGDTWAFTAPLHNPEAGNTGWCVDSSGSAKDVNITFGSVGTSQLGGPGGPAQCP